MPTRTVKKSLYIIGMWELGQLKMFDKPKTHDTPASAYREAERLAKQHSKQFMVFRLTSSFEPAHPPIQRTDYRT